MCYGQSYRPERIVAVVFIPKRKPIYRSEKRASATGLSLGMRVPNHGFVQ